MNVAFNSMAYSTPIPGPCSCYRCWKLCHLIMQLTVRLPMVLWLECWSKGGGFLVQIPTSALLGIGRLTAMPMSFTHYVYVVWEVKDGLL